MPTNISKKALDALAVSTEIFTIVSQKVLEATSKSDLSSIPVIFGHTEETKRTFGSIYVIPSSKKRTAFPLLWDTEPRKYLYPKLFQSLNGPDWSEYFNATTDKNGTLNLSEDLFYGDSEGLPELIDEYLEARLEGQDSKVLLLYRPMFSSIDRFQAAYLDKSDAIAVTNFMKELYGFYPQMDLPMMTAIKATDGLSDNNGFPQVKTSAKTIFRYVAAENIKEAKKKTRLYSSFATAIDYAPEKEWPIFRVALLEDNTPDWKTIREIHSSVDDLATKTAHKASPWLNTLIDIEQRKMAKNLKSALTSKGQKVIL